MKVGKDMEQKKSHLYIKMRHTDDFRKKLVRSQLKKGHSFKKYKRHNLVGRWMLKVSFVDLES